MDVDTHRVELQTLQQRPGETLRELAHRVRRKVRDAYPEMPVTAQESLATQHFKNALVVEKCRESVGLLAPATLKEAVTYAQRGENQDKLNRLRDAQIAPLFQFREIREALGVSESDLVRAITTRRTEGNAKRSGGSAEEGKSDSVEDGLRKDLLERFAQQMLELVRTEFGRVEKGIVGDEARKGTAKVTLFAMDAEWQGM